MKETSELLYCLDTPPHPVAHTHEQYKGVRSVSVVTLHSTDQNSPIFHEQSMDAAIVKSILTTAIYWNNGFSEHLVLPCIFCEFHPAVHSSTCNLVPTWLSYKVLQLSMYFLNQKIFLIDDFSLANKDAKSWLPLPWGNTMSFISLYFWESLPSNLKILSLWDLILHYFSGDFRSWAHSGFTVWFVNSMLAFHYKELFSVLQGVNQSNVKFAVQLYFES